MTRLLACLTLGTALFAMTGCGSSSTKTESVPGNAALVDGGPTAFRAALRERRGMPVVVNQWASWCGPCRAEFPVFREEATRLRGRVAFLGVNSRDSRSDAEAFLKGHPVPYRSYADEQATIARTFRGGRVWPTTAFYNASGRLTFTHQGQYASRAALRADIDRYGING